MKMTLADHAEAWWKEQGKEVPARNTEEWQQMYETWVEWAFSDLHGEEKRNGHAHRTTVA
jgi:hypothetical protein